MAVLRQSKHNEALAILCLGSAILMALALVGYDSLDRSLNVVGPNSGFSNYAGSVGAYLADIVLQLVGVPGFLLPVGLLLLSYRSIRPRSDGFPVLQISGWLLVLLSICTLLYLGSDWFRWDLDHAIGGLAGIVLGSFLLSQFNLAGSVVVVSTLLLLALLLSTRFSINTALDLAVGIDWNLVRRLRGRLSDWQARRQDRKQIQKIRKEQTHVLNQIPASSNLGRESVRQSAESPSEIIPPPTLNWESYAAPAAGPPLDSLDDGPPPVTVAPKKHYRLPPLSFLNDPEATLQPDEEELLLRAEKLTQKYAEFDIRGRILQIHPGPVVTTFEFKPDPGIKYTRITNLVDDLCLAMRADAIRIDRIPGKNTIGIEVPNNNRHTIWLKEIVASTAFQQSPSLLTMGLGKLINGNTYITDLARMPHLLIAGATGAGKSVAVNCLVCSTLYKAGPDEVKFIMIDPKRLELGLYRDIPHLLTPIVTDPKQAANALDWAVREMERRYKMLAEQGVRNLAQFNKLADRTKPPADKEGNPIRRLPVIVVIVDELADLMMTAGKEVEGSLTRLAQMARAIGIHLLLATQRPSVDVITGLIKANFPSRISFRVSSKVDSRTVLDVNGAEQLLGQGDMLFLSPRTARPVRIHGSLVTEEEIQRVADFLREQGQPDYRKEILERDDEREKGLLDVQDLSDPHYDEAARFVVENRKASTSLLQRRLRIGYGRAARLLDIMEHEGIVGPPDGSKPREVLVPINHFDEVDDRLE